MKLKTKLIAAPILIVIVAFVWGSVFFSTETKKVEPVIIQTESKDTTILQQVWYYKGQYALMTVVRTDNTQNYNSKYSDFHIEILGQGYAPYVKDTIGSFSFIKSIKQSEYSKAIKFRDSLQKENVKEKLIQDSINILNSIK